MRVLVLAITRLASIHLVLTQVLVSCGQPVLIILAFFNWVRSSASSPPQPQPTTLRKKKSWPQKGQDFCLRRKTQVRKLRPPTPPRPPAPAFGSAPPVPSPNPQS